MLPKARSAIDGLGRSHASLPPAQLPAVRHVCRAAAHGARGAGRGHRRGQPRLRLAQQGPGGIRPRRAGRLPQRRHVRMHLVHRGLWQRTGPCQRHLDPGCRQVELVGRHLPDRRPITLPTTPAMPISCGSIWAARCCPSGSWAPNVKDEQAVLTFLADAALVALGGGSALPMPSVTVTPATGLLAMFPPTIGGKPLGTQLATAARGRSPVRLGGARHGRVSRCPRRPGQDIGRC